VVRAGRGESLCSGGFLPELIFLRILALGDAADLRFVKAEGINLTVSKNRDVMKSTCLAIALGRRRKAQFAIKRGSVVSYVTKRIAGWNAALRACRF
jgi:hypothetical protein